MPVVRVEWLAGRGREQKADLSAAITESVARIGGCAPEHVQVVFLEVPASDWAVGGVLNDEAKA